MSETKIKVSELPEQEQKDLIAEAYAVGLTGFNFTSYKVETLKNKIAEQKAKNEEEKGSDGDNKADEQETSTDEQSGSAAEGESEANPFNAAEQANGGDDEQNAQNDEQNGSEDEQANDEGENDDSIPEGASDETKAFLNGETDELPTDAEIISEETAKELEKEAVKPQKKEVKTGGICHICRSKVVDGVCSGCGFHK